MGPEPSIAGSHSPHLQVAVWAPPSTLRGWGVRVGVGWLGALQHSLLPGIRRRTQVLPRLVWEVIHTNTQNQKLKTKIPKPKNRKQNTMRYASGSYFTTASRAGLVRCGLWWVPLESPSGLRPYLRRLGWSAALHGANGCAKMPWTWLKQRE